MILIAESGSSKTSWVIHHLGKNQHLESSGLNPYFNSEDEIKNHLLQALPKEVFEHCKEIYFYGAGCHAEENKQKLLTVFKSQFSHVKNIEINDDLTAALRATCGTSEGIACILGTGSGSVYGKEGKVLKAKLGNGIWLGDEGSGGHLGKLLLKAYLDNELPIEIREPLESDYKLTRAVILERVYKSEKPNTYLASFAPFILKHDQNEFIQLLIEHSFKLFFEKNVHIYPNYKKLEISFVGSIAHHYRKHLENLAQLEKLSIKSVIHRPIDRLIEYHL